MQNSSRKALVITYGCRQNENDSERIRGMLEKEGYAFCESTAEADLVIFNTCAVRENAEHKLYGNVGALKAYKERKPHMIIGICGCMVQQDGEAEQIKKRFRHVDFVFGTHAIPRLPKILREASHERVFDTEETVGIYEDLPIKRDSILTANIPISYGCNNFCSYCVVPYVRGRERSRMPEAILNEASELAKAGCKEVILLGQNVNSYGNDNSVMSFPQLLREIDKIDGIERIRFISSHPKDLSDDLVDAMAECESVCAQLHLPFQSGSDRVLKGMNRKYTSADYLKLIDKARSRIPNISLSSDVIVGFPTETQEDFEDTIKLINTVGFDTLYTFIYSPRRGTPAAKKPSVLTEEQIKANFERLVDVQSGWSLKKNKELENKTLRILVEGRSKNNLNTLSGRTEGNKVVNFIGDESLIGSFVDVTVTKALSWSLEGKINN
ncbi:MAG: tRNA (N6-isopentenyl adenosine(37)-C2)-methylthiotransferase MiaB [Eubacteriales bacterium]|nr:tRNA (N6-isopentenyl adenosine(37)-C2)-methylthiotransferase MiaB [Eubacteriales bacterium]